MLLNRLWKLSHSVAVISLAFQLCEKWSSQHLNKLRQNNHWLFFFAFVPGMFLSGVIDPEGRGKEKALDSLAFTYVHLLLLCTAVTQIMFSTRPPVERALLMDATAWFFCASSPGCMGNPESICMMTQIIWTSVISALHVLCQFKQEDGGSRADCDYVGLQLLFL